MPDDTAGFIGFAGRKRQKQLGQGHGLAYAPSAHDESELTEQEREPQWRRFAFLAQRQSAPAAFRQSRRGRSLCGRQRPDQRSLQIELKLPPRLGLGNVMQEAETPPEMVDSFNMGRSPGRADSRLQPSLGGLMELARRSQMVGDQFRNRRAAGRAVLELLDDAGVNCPPFALNHRLVRRALQQSMTKFVTAFWTGMSC